jgi:hypothetical protein
MRVSPTQTGRRFERLSFIRQRALGRVGDIADQLYATAPEDVSALRRTVYGHNRLDSGRIGGNKQWEVHYDPYYITVV